MSNWAYYNEIDPFAAQWLENLMSKNLIAQGVVDKRSVEDVSPDELREFTQCHFFAGVGVWSHALRKSGWDDSRSVWTGSCPCQPFSSAGKGNGFTDERHLWPAWFHLIEQCKPTTIFGEQVASKDGLTWLDLVQSDLEAAGYTNAALDLCAAGFGAPHIRQRLWFVANSESERWLRSENPPAKTGRLSSEERSIVNGFWENAEWRGCRDGKLRSFESGSFPLANGIAGRVGRLRAYGNAINAEVATAFISAYQESVC
ncbi:TPA: DNA cytosine methyltransferase [Vibrio alginolyticus]